MKKSLILVVIAISSIFISCAIAVRNLRLVDRTLLIDPKTADLIYPYIGEKCKHPNRRIFKRCKDVRIVDRYDLSDKEVRMKLIDSGFSCQSKMRFKY